MRMNRPVLAMVMCVRDEADFLPYHLAYHHALGVTRAYVFLDRCADATATVLGSCPWARAIDADRDPDVESLPVYQQRCADRALEMARAEGIDWLMHLDADEFAWGDNPAPGGGLLSLLRRRPNVLER